MTLFTGSFSKGSTGKRLARKQLGVAGNKCESYFASKIKTIMAAMKLELSSVRCPVSRHHSGWYAGIFPKREDVHVNGDPLQNLSKAGASIARKGFFVFSSHYL